MLGREQVAATNGFTATATQGEIVSGNMFSSGDDDGNKIRIFIDRNDMPEYNNTICGSI